MNKVTTAAAVLAAGLLTTGTAAQAQNLLLGVGPSYQAGAVTAYTPAGVTFTPEATLGVKGTTASPAPLGSNGGVDTPYWFMAYWFKTLVGSPAHNLSSFGHWTGYLTQYHGSNDDGTFLAEGVPGYTNVTDNAGSSSTLRWSPHDSDTSDTQSGHEFNYTNPGFTATVNAQWHYYMVAGNFAYASGSKRFAFYLDGVKVTSGSAAEVGTLPNPFVINMNSKFGWGINASVGNVGNKGGVFDMADFVMDTKGTVPTSCAEIIDSSNNICPALVARGYNAGPVDPGTNCAALLGYTPDVCLKGNKAGFQTNQGTAVAFTLTNAISGSTATPVLYNAPSNPGATPDIPTFRWINPAAIAGLTTTSTTFTVNNYGGPIAAGDLLLVATSLTESSATAVNRNVTPPTGWAGVQGTSTTTSCGATTGAATLPCFSATHPFNAGLFYHVATSADVTAPGADWSNAPTFTYTSNGVTFRGATSEVINYGQVNAATPIEAIAAQFNATTTSPVAPSVTAPSGPANLLTFVWNYDAGRTGEPYPPSSQDLRFKYLYISGSGITSVMLSDERLATAGATGTRAATFGLTGEAITASVVIGK